MGASLALVAAPPPLAPHKSQRPRRLSRAASSEAKMLDIPMARTSPERFITSNVCSFKPLKTSVMPLDFKRSSRLKSISMPEASI